MNVAQMIEWLKQFPEDAIVNVSNGVSHVEFTAEADQYEVEQGSEAWTYVPNEAAVARGMVGQHFPARPAEINLGEVIDD